jgi:hypothetical protein
MSARYGPGPAGDEPAGPDRSDVGNNAQVSNKKFVIFWSARYFRRLWCASCRLKITADDWENFYAIANR